MKFESRYVKAAETAAEARAKSREIARINLRGRGLRENLLQPLAYTISDAAAISGAAQAQFHALVKVGIIPTRENGATRVILHEDLMAWLLSLPLHVPPLHHRDKVIRATTPCETTPGNRSPDHRHPRKTGRKNRAYYRRTTQAAQARRRSRAKPRRIRRAQSARPLIRVP